MTISIQAIKNITAFLLDSLPPGITNIDPTFDYYWSLSSDERINLDVAPLATGMGQISDDWSDLNKMLAQPYRPDISVFKNLAEIFRMIGERQFADVSKAEHGEI